MAAIRVEFTSPTSGNYIHEMANELTIEFTDADGKLYTLCPEVRYVEKYSWYTLDLNLTYPDGIIMGLESITLDPSTVHPGEKLQDGHIVPDEED